jgi:hypothetical protein
MASILDLDLWQPAAAGRDDRFDAHRFGEWLAALMDEGEAVAARVVAAMDRSLAIVGLSRYVRVFDPGVLSMICPRRSMRSPRCLPMRGSPPRDRVRCLDRPLPMRRA